LSESGFSFEAKKLENYFYFYQKVLIVKDLIEKEGYFEDSNKIPFGIL
jgi:hypothetical protein